MLYDMVIARARMNVTEMKRVVAEEKLVAGERAGSGLSHQLGHATRAVGERLVAIGDRLDDEAHCQEHPKLNQPGLAHH